MRHRLRLPLRYAHRGPLHPGRYGRGLHRHSMRFTSRAVFAATPLTSICPARLKGRATRPPFDGLRVAACHVLCVRRRAPQARLRSKVALRQAQGSEVAAAQLRPTVAVAGESGVFDEDAAATRQRQAARRRARLPPQPFDYAQGRGVTAPTSHNGAIMRSFTPSHGPRGRGPRLGVHTLGLPGATPRWNRTGFCSLGAARPRLRSR